jgi:hypothetical protein|tara:strand:- start:659 stop:805 length:147 start_codon:yes stop_codon:yes gene_type:complete
MAKMAVGAGAKTAPIRKRTSIGSSPLSRVKNKSKRLSHKKYNSQGKAR